MELFFTDTLSLDRPLLVDGRPLTLTKGPYCLPEDARQALCSNVVPEGMPFVLDWAGRYDLAINRFLRDLPADSCSSVNTWKAYARDLVTFCRFLRECCGGKGVFDATRADIALYYRTRLLADDGRVVQTSWNRAITALDKFYQWALGVGLITSVPFTYKFATGKYLGGSRPAVARNNALAKGGARDGIKCISLEEYLQFREVGLLGRLPDGTLDRNFHGRNSLRNAAFAEFLVTTGVRLEEGISVLRAEIPDPDAQRWARFRSCKMRLARLTTKGDKGRSVYLPKRVLNEFILPYIQEERDNAVGKGVAEGRYRIPNPLRVTEWRLTDCTIQSGAVSEQQLDYERLGPEDRERMFSWHCSRGLFEPGFLWLTEQGASVTTGNFDKIFNRACERLREFGIDLWVTPHTLRHTFAVYMLSQLIRETIGTVVGIGREKSRMGDNSYRRVVSDPLRTVQRLLGHASITTTYKYLTYIEEAEELLDQAVGGWGDRLGTPPAAEEMNP